MAEDADANAITPIERRAWWRSLVLGAVIFVCGAAVGSIITAVVVEQRPPRGIRRMDRLPERIAQEMRRKYRLSEEQERRLRDIFEEHGKKLSDIRIEVQPRVETEHDALRRAVETVLTPEQAKMWRTEFEQMRRPWHSRSGP